MNTSKYIIYKKGKYFYFKLCASNGKILFTSERYTRQRNAVAGITVIAQLVKQNPRVTFEN